MYQLKIQPRNRSASTIATSAEYKELLSTQIIRECRRLNYKYTVVNNVFLFDKKIAEAMARYLTRTTNCKVFASELDGNTMPTDRNIAGKDAPKEEAPKDAPKEKPVVIPSYKLLVVNKEDGKAVFAGKKRPFAETIAKMGIDHYVIPKSETYYFTKGAAFYCAEKLSQRSTKYAVTVIPPKRNKMYNLQVTGKNGVSTILRLGESPKIDEWVAKQNIAYSVSPPHNIVCLTYENACSFAEKLSKLDGGTVTPIEEMTASKENKNMQKIEPEEENVTAKLLKMPASCFSLGDIIKVIDWHCMSGKGITQNDIKEILQRGEEKRNAFGDFFQGLKNSTKV